MGKGKWHSPSGDAVQVAAEDQENDPELPTQENDDVSDALHVALTATVEPGSLTQAPVQPLSSELDKAGVSVGAAVTGRMSAFGSTRTTGSR